MTLIDGGGHSVFGATYDPSVWMNTNDNGFIHVEMQYRLGAFGYLSSQEVKDNGVLNAGLLDQRFAIEWVKKHISKFGGDPERITIGGESSGAGSAMFHALAYGGQETSLFKNVTNSVLLSHKLRHVANHTYI
jgi:carboxylesterase type B